VQGAPNTELGSCALGLLKNVRHKGVGRCRGPQILSLVAALAAAKDAIPERVWGGAGGL
jgi:hypothetical protein